MTPSVTQNGTKTSHFVRVLDREEWCNHTPVSKLGHAVTPRHSPLGLSVTQLALLDVCCAPYTEPLGRPLGDEDAGGSWLLAAETGACLALPEPPIRAGNLLSCLD